MKKKIIILLTIFIITLLFIASIIFLKDARKKRSWPFNSGLVLHLPQWVKYYAYKFTNPEDNILTTQFYKIKLEYINIPYTKSIGGGGSINQIDTKNVLVTLNDGTGFNFNLEDKTFDKFNNTFERKYVSIRDVTVTQNKKEIYVLAVINVEPECKKIILDKYNLKTKNRVLLSNNDRIWKSEKLCNNPMESNGGGRVIKYKNDIFVSTGFFAQNINSGIFEYSQNINSSFGKIIKISRQNNSYSSEVYSIGHRNPQGLFVSKKFNRIYSTEHGPQGGDELNLILKGKNYGWPCISFGTKYSYSFKKDSEIWPSKKNLKKIGCDFTKNFQPPVFAWSPSIGASQGLEYSGLEFPEFNNNFLISSLKATSIYRVKMLTQEKIINLERIFINERIRDFVVLISGKILVYTDGGNLILISRT